MVNFETTHRNLTPDDIAQVEADLGLRLPDGFRKHYLSYNGGGPIPSCFKKNGEIYVTNWFFPMKEKQSGNSFEEMYRILVAEESNFPTGFVPFAIDDGGELIVFSTRRQDYGAIYLSRQDYFDDPERCTEYLADSLDSFLAGLVDAPD